MNLLTNKLLRVASLALALPILGTCAAVQVNAVCYVGNCDSPDSIGVGQTSAGSFNFNYSFADGDLYSVTGTYSNSYPGIHTSFQPTVTYLSNDGNIFTPSVQTDVLSLVMSQNFYDPTGSSWAGTYCQDIPLAVTSLARANGNTYFDGNGIGFITQEGPGSSNQSHCAYFPFTASQNASPTMVTQTLLDFTFLGGNIAPASISSVTPPPPSAAPLTLLATSDIASVPEPAQLLPVGLLLIALSAFRFRTRKSATQPRG